MLSNENVNIYIYNILDKTMLAPLAQVLTFQGAMPPQTSMSALLNGWALPAYLYGCNHLTLLTCVCTINSVEHVQSAVVNQCCTVAI